MVLRERPQPTPSSRPASGTSRPEWRPRPSSSPGPRARGSRTSTGAPTSTSPEASAARTPATGCREAVAAIHEQVDRYLHQCFMVGMYEPYVEVCRRLAELAVSRRRAEEPAPELGRRGGRERGQDRPGATGRHAVVVFDRAFHGRTLLTMTMTSKVVPYKRGFGPFAPEVYRAPAPYPYRGVSTDDAIHGLEALFSPTSTPRPSPASCSSR